MGKRAVIAGFAAVVMLCTACGVTGLEINVNIPEVTQGDINEFLDHGRSVDSSMDKMEEQAEVQSLTAEPEPVSKQEPEPVGKPTGESNIQSSAYILDKLYKTKKDNVLISPMSLNMALGMIENGAEGKTKAALCDFLGTDDYNSTASQIMERYYNPPTDASDENNKGIKEIPTVLAKKTGMPEKDIFSIFSMCVQDGLITSEEISEMSQKTGLTGQQLVDIFIEYHAPLGVAYAQAEDNPKNKEKSTLNVANSVWVADNRKIVPSFKDIVEDIYKAEVSNINTGNPEESAGKINNWCSDHTAGLIPQIVTEEHITPETSMVLINTVYFNSSWTEEWYPKDGTFTDVSGNRKDMEVIRNEVDSYYENDQATAFGMGYLNGLKFIGILPKKEGDSNVSDIDVKGILESDKSSEYDEIYGEMPRLKFDTDNSILKNALSELGLSVIFDPSKADFPGIVEKGTNGNTWVDDVIQKCTIDLDEYGTEASSATAVLMEANGMAIMPEKEPKIVEVILDRPFMFAIVDPESGQVAFMGKVVKAE